MCMCTWVGTEVGVHKLLMVPINSSCYGGPWSLDTQVAVYPVTLQFMSLTKAGQDHMIYSHSEDN